MPPFSGGNYTSARSSNQVKVVIYGLVDTKWVVNSASALFIHNYVFKGSGI